MLFVFKRVTFKTTRVRSWRFCLPPTRHTRCELHGLRHSTAAFQLGVACLKNKFMNSSSYLCYYSCLIYNIGTPRGVCLLGLTGFNRPPTSHPYIHYIINSPPDRQFQAVTLKPRNYTEAGTRDGMRWDGCYQRCRVFGISA